MELMATRKNKRNIYAGAVGYFSFTNDVDTCIAIRTLAKENKFCQFSNILISCKMVLHICKQEGALFLILILRRSTKG